MVERSLPAHEALSRIRTDDDCLVFAGRKLTDIAAAIGRTPFYAYDSSAISDRVATLRELLPSDIKIHYAIKANPMPELVKHLVRVVDGLDVASERELQVALRSGCDPAEISFAGPGKQSQELVSAIDSGIVINLESIAEMRRLDQLSRDRGARPRVAIRVNPDFELRTSGMKMSGGPKQFGIDAECVPELLQELAGLQLDFVGFHIFAGSQNLSAEAIAEAQAKTMDLAIRLAAAAPSPVRLLNLGGGFGIPYFPGERSLDVGAVGIQLTDIIARGRRELPEAEFVIELGRYLVGEAGIYVCKVLDRKISRGQVYLVTDGGLHHHLAASGNFGQVLRKNYPVIVGNRVLGEEREIASVVGPLCTPLDVLGDRMDLARAGPGDLIAVLQSGAYGLTASPLGFLSHPAPEEVLL